MSLGSGEILLCLFVALVVLGPEQLPKAARDFGRALAELRKLNSAVQGQINDFMKMDDTDTMPAVNRKSVAYTPPSGGRHFSPDTPAEAADPGEFRQVDEVLETRPYAPPTADEEPYTERQVGPPRPPE